jgi:hypothetical protein
MKQATPPSENQQLEDARIAMEQAIVRITELEQRVDSYRRQYNALWDAARVVIQKGHYQADTQCLMVSRTAFDTLSRCVSSTSGESAPALVEETQTPHTPRPWLGICPRCGTALNSVSPGISVVAGGTRICTSCLLPDETEIARAKSLT